MQFLQCCLSGRLREFKNKGKVHLGNAKKGPGRVRERSVTKSQFKRGFTEMVLTGGLIISREKNDCVLKTAIGKQKNRRF